MDLQALFQSPLMNVLTFGIIQCIRLKIYKLGVILGRDERRQAFGSRGQLALLLLTSYHTKEPFLNDM
jgi:hypothetical protein